MRANGNKTDAILRKEKKKRRDKTLERERTGRKKGEEQQRKNNPGKQKASQSVINGSRNYA